MSTDTNGIRHGYVILDGAHWKSREAAMPKLGGHHGAVARRFGVRSVPYCAPLCCRGSSGREGWTAGIARARSTPAPTGGSGSRQRCARCRHPCPRMSISRRRASSALQARVPEPREKAASGRLGGDVGSRFQRTAQQRPSRNRQRDVHRISRERARRARSARV